MSLSWKWCDCTPAYTDKCPGCKERAMVRPDGLVHLTDVRLLGFNHWHVDCLLNFLTSPPPAPKLEFTEDDLKEAMHQMGGVTWHAP